MYDLHDSWETLKRIAAGLLKVTLINFIFSVKGKTWLIIVKHTVQFSALRHFFLAGAET